MSFAIIYRKRCDGRMVYTGWLKLKYPSSKFAISWQQHIILRPILQQYYYQLINEQIHRIILIYLQKRQIYSTAKVKAPF